jgi:hypothetical protein
VWFLTLSPLVALLAAVIWIVYQRLDPAIGFDYAGHLDYIRYIDFTGSIPLADRGWQTYHPPAFYALAAAVFEAMHRVGWAGTITDAGRWVSTSAWVLEGVTAIATVRLIGGGWVASGVAAALVWLLPGQSIMGSMLYNETLTGLGVGLLTMGLVLWWRRRTAGLALLAAGFALALLSKYSGAVAAATALPIILYVGRDRLRATVLALGPGLILGAAYYGRNLLTFGTPTPLNSELFHLATWDPIGWGHPAGFFTTLDLSRCAAHYSFWGGFWKWFWAVDCYGARLPWQPLIGRSLMVGALLATVVVAVALAWSATRALKDPVFLYLIAIPVALFFAFLAYNLRVPSPTADKGVYLLAAIVPVAVATGLFAQRAARSWMAVVLYVAVLAWSLDMAHASGLG